ncbi:ketopantoate reductase [Thermovibrio guaymasensis]|uniref:2-dehydropantoate 2-reductase n=1 Tax=Thermovibrio guaymasensis TaxID=240167 RepID=A0A420W837_9BACT|nr:2-dehydropantoate 2-reductase [Thermovibrio guaymasensis]RKQ63464.1 ketopantoate reductase [Thermovibrio guaymasensis]
MEFAVFGAGGVGSLYGSLLARCGHRVVFIARGEHLKAMKEKGLKVKSYKYGEFTVKEEPPRVVFTDNPKEAGKVDAVLVCVKSYDTEKVAPQIEPLLKENTVVISVQNGIENEEILAKYVGKERVLGATAFVGTYVKEPGVVVHEAAGLLEVGELSGKPSKRVEKLVEELKKCGVEARVSRDINYTLWKKLMWNVAFNPYSVITRATVGEILSQPETYEIVKNLMLECIEVAKAYGVKLKEKTLEGYLKSSPDLMNYKTSMLLDYEKGKPIEIEGITGALIRKAKEKGIDVPYNKCVYGTVKLLLKKREQ